MIVVSVASQKEEEWEERQEGEEVWQGKNPNRHRWNLNRGNDKRAGLLYSRLFC